MIIISNTVSVSFTDWPDDENSAIIIYFTGCSNNCENCQNAQTLANKNNILLLKEKNPKLFKVFNKQNNYNNYSYLIFDENQIEDFDFYLTELSKKHGTNYFIFQGGDPFYKDNKNFVLKYLNYNYSNSNKKICIYTGSEIGEIKRAKAKANFFKCGKFNRNLFQTPGKDKKSLTLASSNQNFYDKNYRQISKNGILLF